MKKILAIAIVAIMMLQASVIFAADTQTIAYKFKPELDGVINEGEYEPQSTFVCDYENVLAQGVFLNDYNANTMPKDEKYEVSYAWDNDNLYLAVSVVDKTPVPAKCWDLTGTNGGTGRSDGIQLNTFVNKDFGKWFMFTVAQDGTVYTCGIYNQFSELDERQNFTSLIPGKGAWNENGYCFEVAIPWALITLGRTDVSMSDSEKEWYNTYVKTPWDEAGIKIKEGTKMAFTIAAQNVDAAGNRGRYTNDVFHNNLLLSIIATICSFNLSVSHK